MQNQVLSLTCKYVKKELKTHTFRIEITINFIQVGKVEGAQKIIRDPNSTLYAVYNSTHYKQNLFLL